MGNKQRTNSPYSEHDADGGPQKTRRQGYNRKG